MGFTIDCHKVRKLLSEYIDNTLSPENKNNVERHLKICKACSDEYGDLKAIAGSLNSLKPVRAPEDFLKNVQYKIEKSCRFKKILKTLFIPPKLRMPLECAGVLATAFFIAFLMGIPQRIMHREQRYEQSHPPLISQRTGVERKEEKPLSPPATGDQDVIPIKNQDTRREKIVLLPQKKIAEKKKELMRRIELVLILAHEREEKRLISRSETSPEDKKPESEAPQSASDDSDKIMTQRRYLSKGTWPETEEKKGLLKSGNEELDIQIKIPEKKDIEAIEKIKTLVKKVEGANLSANYDQETRNKLKIIADIPWKNYAAFLKELEQIGNIECALGESRGDAH